MKRHLSQTGMSSFAKKATLPADCHSQRGAGEAVQLDVRARWEIFASWSLLLLLPPSFDLPRQSWSVLAGLRFGLVICLFVDFMLTL